MKGRATGIIPDSGLHGPVDAREGRVALLSFLFDMPDMIGIRAKKDFRYTAFVWRSGEFQWPEMDESPNFSSIMDTIMAPAASGRRLVEQRQYRLGRAAQFRALGRH